MRKFKLFQQTIRQVYFATSKTSVRYTHGSNVPPQRIPSPGVSEITSLTNTYVKHLLRLRVQNSYREEVQRTLLLGAEPIEELFHQGGGIHINVLILNEAAERPKGIIADQVVTVTKHVFEKLAGIEKSRGDEVAAEVRLPTRTDFRGIEWKHMGLRRLLVLENVRDPGNLGTLLRSAVAFGWDGAFMIPPVCDPYNDKALRASRGAALSLPLAYGTWEELLEIADMHKLRKFAAQLPLVGEKKKKKTSELITLTLGQQTSVHVTEKGLLNSGLLLVVGHEAQGLSAEADRLCQHMSIPMPGNMESLNVGVAGSILMFALSDGLPKLLSDVQQFAKQ